MGTKKSKKPVEASAGKVKESRNARGAASEVKAAEAIKVMSEECCSLRKACDKVGILLGTFLCTIDRNKLLADQYTRARGLMLEKMAEDLLEIADDGSNDTYTDDEGNERTNHDVINRSRLRVDSRKWILSKLVPKKYGDKVEVENTGTIGVKMYGVGTPVDQVGGGPGVLP